MNIYSILSKKSLKLENIDINVKDKKILTMKKKPTMKTTKEKDTIVLLDLSNFIFQRFYAVNTWCNLSDNAFSSQEECIAMYERMFQKHLLNIKKKCKCTWENLYMAIDCSRDTIWRLKYYNEYKQNRSVKLKHELIPHIFQKTYNEIIPTLQKTHGFKTLKCPEAEADDIIGIVSHHVREKYPSRYVVVISNDSDYIQLIDDYTSVYNQSFKNLIDRIPKELICSDIKLMGCNYLKYKILKGDTSDNISQVFSRTSAKSIIDMIFDDDKLQEKLDINNNRERYDTNNLIINLKMTPEYIRKKVLENLKSI